jgi:23S rRNA (guanosine2251-2'-O)-methyltransferase
MSILLGKKALLDNIDNKDIISVDLSANNIEIINLLKQKKIKFTIQNENFFKRFDVSLNHQNVLVHLNDGNKIDNIDSLLKLSKQESIILVLDGIQDSQNFGAILRSCDAFGVDAVIYKKDNQVQVNDFVIKSSMGAIQHLNLIRVTNLARTLEQLKQAGYWIYASALNTKAQNINDIKFDKKTVIVVGNENKGVANLLLDKSDFIIKIPMVGHVQSLNVSVATGILLNATKK